MGDTHNHNGVIDMVKNNMPNEKSINALAELFKVFGDQTRTKILSVLELTSEMCVCDICECVDMSKSAVSHQLRILRTAKLVKTRKQGKEVFYSLDDEHVSKIIDCGLNHINEED